MEKEHPGSPTRRTLTNRLNMKKRVWIFMAEHIESLGKQCATVIKRQSTKNTVNRDITWYTVRTLQLTDYKVVSRCKQSLKRCACVNTVTKTTLQSRGQQGNLGCCPMGRPVNRKGSRTIFLHCAVNKWKLTWVMNSKTLNFLCKLRHLRVSSCRILC